uniref:Leucine-rich repeat protein soc-2 homolog n=1 Tax=Timema monikensis TaxID=170555 RepID=A0A7R9EE75_9NEOP|nr:unnamed protein product [Timema monikensis]
MDDLWLTLQRNIFQLDTILNLYNVAVILVGVVVLLVVTYLWLWWVCDIHHRFLKQGIENKIKISKIKSRDKAKIEVQKLSEVYVLAELEKKLHPIEREREKEAKLLNSDIKRKAKAKLKSRLKQLARVKKQGRIEQEAKELLKIKAELRTRIRTRQIDKDIQTENEYGLLLQPTKLRFTKAKTTTSTLVCYHIVNRMKCAGKLEINKLKTITYSASARSHGNNGAPCICVRIVSLSARQLHAVVSATNSIDQIVEHGASKVFAAMRPTPFYMIETLDTILAPNSIKETIQNSDSYTGIQRSLLELTDYINKRLAFTARGYPEHIVKSQIKSNQEPMKKQPSNDILLIIRAHGGGVERSAPLESHAGVSRKYEASERVMGGVPLLPSPPSCYGDGLDAGVGGERTNPTLSQSITYTYKTKFESEKLLKITASRNDRYVLGVRGRCTRTQRRRGPNYQHYITSCRGEQWRTINSISQTRFDERLLRLSKLQELNLSHNKLTSLPEALGMMPCLKILHLENNCLGENIFDWRWMNGSHIAKTLRLLDLSDNKFSSLVSSVIILVPLCLSVRYQLNSKEGTSIHYSPELIPMVLIDYLNDPKFCVCNTPCFKTYFKTQMGISLEKIASSIQKCNESIHAVPVDVRESTAAARDIVALISLMLMPERATYRWCWKMAVWDLVGPGTSGNPKQDSTSCYVCI